MSGGPTSASARRDWLAGVVLGAPAGFLLLEGGIVGVLYVGLALGLVAWKGPRLAAFGGLVIGAGAVALLLLLRTVVSCGLLNASGEGRCELGNVGAWVAIAGVVAAVGLVLSVLALVRRAR